jgi:hypothetical protein
VSLPARLPCLRPRLIPTIRLHALRHHLPTCSTRSPLALRLRLHRAPPLLTPPLLATTARPRCRLPHLTTADFPTTPPPLQHDGGSHGGSHHRAPRRRLRLRLLTTAPPVPRSPFWSPPQKQPPIQPHADRRDARLPSIEAAANGLRRCRRCQRRQPEDPPSTWYEPILPPTWSFVFVLMSSI